MALLRSLNTWKLEPVDWAIEKQTSLTDLNMGTFCLGQRPVFVSSALLVGDLWHGTSCVGQPTWPMFIGAVMLGGVSLLFPSLHTVYNGFQHTQCSPAYWLQTARWTNLYSERKSVCLFLFLPDLGINLRKLIPISFCLYELFLLVLFACFLSF